MALILFSVLIGRVLFWCFKKLGRRITKLSNSKLDDIILDMVEEPAVVAMVSGGIYFAIVRLDLSPRLTQVMDLGLRALFTFCVTWFFAKTVSKIIEVYIVPLVEKSESDLDDQLLPVLRKGLVLGIWSLGIIIALNNAGFDVAALIAGMGIGGLALAMAAKDTVSNFFGGITIFVDRPFKLNDRIKIGGYDGSIVEIGIRSTRLKTLEGRIVTIPNSKFSDSMVENVSLEPSRKILMKLGLTYDTPEEKMKLAMDLLRTIVSENGSTEENIIIGFDSFGDFSLGITLIYYIRSGENIMDTQTQINLRILNEFNQNNLSFAFPTQTIEVIK